MKLLAILCIFGCSAAVAQGVVIELEPLDDPHGTVETIETDPNVIISPLTGEIIALDESVTAQPRVRVEAGGGAVLRWLDKVSGDVRDVELASGEAQTLGRIEIALGECRYPANDVAGEAYAWLDIKNLGRETSEFSGWMLASSPALSALDHPRYDVWVIRCTTT